MSSSMRARPIKILPSILSADFSRLGDDVRAVMQAGGDCVHVDIMDGHFVPNITFGPDVMKSIRHVTDKPFDVHLMISPVDLYLKNFADAGADVLTIHAEAGPHVHRSLQTIRALGKKAGIAINPGTPESLIEPVLDDVDLFLAMSVNPGFGGQKFIAPVLDKVRRIRAMVADRDIDIEVDGGVTPETAGECVRAGINWLVAGSAIFKGGAPAYAANIAAIRQAAEAARGTSI